MATSGCDLNFSLHKRMLPPKLCRTTRTCTCQKESVSEHTDKSNGIRAESMREEKCNYVMLIKWCNLCGAWKKEKKESMLLTVCHFQNEFRWFIFFDEIRFEDFGKFFHGWTLLLPHQYSLCYMNNTYTEYNLCISTKLPDSCGPELKYVAACNIDGVHQKNGLRSENFHFYCYLSVCNIFYLIRKDSNSCNEIYFTIRFWIRYRILPSRKKYDSPTYSNHIFDFLFLCECMRCRHPIFSAHCPPDFYFSSTQLKIKSYIIFDVGDIGMRPARK